MVDNLEYKYLDREPKADDVVECLENTNKRKYRTLKEKRIKND